MVKKVKKLLSVVLALSMTMSMVTLGAFAKGDREETEINPVVCTHENTEVEVRNAKPATCTEKGYTGDTYCIGCGEKIATGEEIAVLEISIVEGETVVTITARQQEMTDNAQATVTLTYDANAGDDEVTGLPASQTTAPGKTVTISNFRNMEREGYAMWGWSTDPNATWSNATYVQIGSKYTLNEDTTLYAVWEKLAVEETVEVPAGAKLQTVTISPSFYDSNSNTLDANLQPYVTYEYSYTYGGTTYTGEARQDTINPGLGVVGGVSRNLFLDVFTDDTGATPTEVTLTLKEYDVKGYNWYAQMAYDATGWVQAVSTKGIAVSVNAGTQSIWTYNYYQKEAEPVTVTEREIDIRVTFEIDEQNAFTLDKVNSNYSLTYSYETAEGTTESKTLYYADAEKVTTNYRDGDVVTDKTYESLNWKVTVPVIDEGNYLTIAQDNYDVSESPYVWSGVHGTTDRADAENIGKLYVSLRNNPVTAYIFNEYTKQFTVIYVDGMDDEEVFADRVCPVLEGTATPAFEGTPTCEGYAFTGWDKEIAETVTEDVTYTAQWVKLYTVTFDSNGGNGVDSQTVASGATATQPADPTRDGYTFTGWNLGNAAYDFGTPVTEDITLVAQWSQDSTGTGGGNDDDVYYTLTINYVDEEGNTVAPTVSRDVREGRTYTVVSPAIEGMTPDQASVSGTMNGNVTITVTYTADEDLSEPETPLAGTPEESTEEPGEEELPDEKPPMAETPELPVEEELEDEATPLAQVPQTGDGLYLWLTLSALSAMGLAWLTLTEEKKHIA